MKALLSAPLATCAISALLALIGVSPIHAEVRSKSNEIIVLQPKDLPEAAQTPGNSAFLYSDTEGCTYLYIEQQQGARLTTLDVSDPSRIRFVSSIDLTSPAAFDFVRPLGGRAELIRYRDGKGVAVLDLHAAKKPTVRVISGLSESGSTQTLGERAFLMIDEPYNYVRAVPRDYQVMDISSPSSPLLLTTVKEVKHEVVNGDTGTTFLLGSDGLTVIRRINVENDYKINQLHLSSN
jgi:LVIVD repeat